VSPSSLFPLPRAANDMKWKRSKKK
jgi:hypothetical protein